MNRRLTPRLAGVLALLAFVGCQTHESGVTPEVEVRSSTADGGSPRFDESVLNNVGLETHWYNPRDEERGVVRNALLREEGLFVSTFPSETLPARLKLMKRDDGFAKWFYDLDGTLNAEPSVYRYPAQGAGTNDEVFLVLNDVVHCLSLDWGELLWKRRTPFSVSTAIVADEQRFFAGSDNGRVYGVLKNASLDDWTYLTGSFVEADPVVGQSSVFAGSTDGRVYRFSGTAGVRPGFSWDYDTGASIVANPVVFSRWVFIGSTSYKLYCIDAITGSVVWEFLAEAPVVDEPVIYSHQAGKEFVFVIGADKGRNSRTLFCLRSRDGVPEWEFEGIRKVVSLGRQNVYLLTDQASTGKRELISVDLASGEEKFRLAVDERFKYVPTNLADFGRNQKERGKIYFVAENGAMQTIGER